MESMRQDDWRLDDSLSESEIRQKMADEGWEQVEVVGVHYAFTATPSAYAPTTSVSPRRVHLGRAVQSA